MNEVVRFRRVEIRAHLFEEAIKVKPKLSLWKQTLDFFVCCLMVPLLWMVSVLGGDPRQQ